MMVHKSRLLIVDNFDSFTFNLVQLVAECGIDNYDVVRSDCISKEHVEPYSSILISPGPGLPSDFPKMCDVICREGDSVPVLGICLGHQAIAEVYGGRLKRLQRVNHGVTTGLRIIAADEIIFQGISTGEPVGLYHSWVVDNDSLPGCLEVTAESDDGNILAIRHRDYDVRGIQFHPESIMTPVGKRIIENWLYDHH